MPEITLAEINELHRKHYALMWKRFERPLTSGTKGAQRAATRINEMALKLTVPASPEVGLERLRMMPTFEEVLSSFIPARSTTDQSSRARHQRVRIGDDLIPVAQMIRALATATEYRDCTARELWPHLLEKLSAAGSEPKEVKGRTRRLDRVDYQYHQRGADEPTERHLTFGAFANEISKARRAHVNSANMTS